MEQVLVGSGDGRRSKVKLSRTPSEPFQTYLSGGKRYVRGRQRGEDPGVPLHLFWQATRVVRHTGRERHA